MPYKLKMFQAGRGRSRPQHPSLLEGDRTDEEAGVSPVRGGVCACVRSYRQGITPGFRDERLQRKTFDGLRAAQTLSERVPQGQCQSVAG